MHRRLHERTLVVLAASWVIACTYHEILVPLSSFVIAKHESHEIAPPYLQRALNLQSPNPRRSGRSAAAAKPRRTAVPRYVHILSKDSPLYRADLIERSRMPRFTDINAKQEPSGS